MPNTKLGKVSITPSGEFVLGAPYQRLDLVYHDHASYLSKQENTNIPVDHSDVWMKVAEGIVGKSAYETAVEAGYSGSEQDFLNGLTNFESYAQRAETAAQAAQTSQTDAQNSADAAQSHETSAKTSAEKAKTEADRAKFEADRASGVVQIDITIPASSWQDDTDTDGAYALCADIPQADITEELIPIVTIWPQDQSVAQTCGMSTASRTVEGALRVYAARVPEKEIRASLVLLGTGSDGSGGGSGYVLPQATRQRLGGVKIGDGVSVQADGTISIDDTAFVNEVAATDSDVDEMIQNVFPAAEQP